MIDTNQMVSVPTELLEQALDAAAAVGMQDVADELDRILTPSTTQHQVSLGALWRYREKKPRRAWNYTEKKELAEKATRDGYEVQGFSDLSELERLKEENLHHRNLQLEADDLINSLRTQLAERGALVEWWKDHLSVHLGILFGTRGHTAEEAEQSANEIIRRAESLAPQASTRRVPTAQKYPHVEIVRAHKHTCASCKEGIYYSPCDCGAIIDGVAVKADKSAPVAELTDLLPSVAIEDDQLVIRITTECLLHAVTCSSQWPTDEAGIPISIAKGPLLVKEIINELQREDEQGTNPMHRMLDEAALAALDNGSEAVSYDDEAHP